MNTANRFTELLGLSPAQSASLPAYERVLDRLADLLFDADEVLDMLKADDAVSLHWIQPHVQSVYDDVNAVMQKLCE